MKRFRITFDKLIFNGQNIRIFDCDVLPGEDVQEKAIDILESRGIVHGNIISIELLSEK